jgi:hypothetical protein
MANQPPAKPDIRDILFVENEKYSSQYITGVYGGIVNDGIINASFFRDKVDFPTKIQVEVVNNLATKETKKIGGHHITRDIYFEAILDVNTAKVIAEWLINQVAQLEKLKLQRNGSTTDNK